jgi:S-DNA-T family DNA segregation ATPase FtsK/SpoIIIE
MKHKTRPSSYTRKKTAQKRRLIPEHMHVFLADRVTDSFGAVFIAFGAMVFSLLISYNKNDPSFNTSVKADYIIQNWLGAFGAYTADVMIQTIGMAAYLFALTPILWGVFIIKRKMMTHGFLRFVCLLGAVIFTACFLARIPSFDDAYLTPYLGGTLGALLFNGLTGLLHPLIGGTAHFVITLFTALTSFAFILASTGLHKHECLLLGDKLLRLCGYSGKSLLRFAGQSVEWHRTYASQRVKRPLIAINDDRLAKENHITESADDEDEILDAPDDEDENDDEDDDEPAADTPSLLKRLAQKKKIAVERSTKNKTKTAKAKQQSLGFDGAFELPSLDLLDVPPAVREHKLSDDALQKNAELLHSTLTDFGVEGEILKVSPGPVITLYELEPAPGTKSSRVIGLADDIARSMSALSVRVAVIAGKNALGIELPNQKREMVFLREMFSSPEFENTAAKLPLVLGKNIGGEPVIADLAKMPHLLVAGTTGSGKSVGINTMILSLLYRFTPEQCKFIMIDPKMLELSVYDDIPHLITPVVTEPHKAITALKWAVREMENRYRAMSKLGVRNIDGFNTRVRAANDTGEVLMHRVQTGFDADTGKPVFEEQPIAQSELPYIVVIVDEFADLMLVAGKEVEGAIQRLAQMARAAGIHLIMATQRPSVDVITGVIKANFPTRISFQVTSKIDSRTILGDGGAEQLLGQGDMLYMAAGGRLTRVHGPFVSDGEVEDIVKFLKTQGEPVYIDGVTDGDEDDIFKGIMAGGDGDGDDLYAQAVRLVLSERKASTSFIQRHLQIGYNRAARIIERMEKEGIISKANHVGKREILLDEAG